MFVLWRFVLIWCSFSEYISFLPITLGNLQDLQNEFSVNNANKSIEIKDNDGLTMYRGSLILAHISDLRGYFVRYSTAERHVITHLQNQRSCHYVGHVDGQPETRLSINMCEGRQSGSLFDGKSVKLLKYESTWVTVRNDDVTLRATRHSHCRESPAKQRNNHTANRLQFPPKQKRSVDEIKLVEIYVVIDNSLYKRLPVNGPDSPIDFIENMIREMNMIYNHHGIRTVLVGVDLWSQSDPFNLNTDATVLLNDFIDYKEQNIIGKTVKQDFTVLISGLQFQSGIVGMAYVGGMCGTQSAAVIMYDATALDRAHKAAITLAHEMGHTLGMTHDLQTCGCKDNLRKCLMAPDITLEPTELSACSTMILKKLFVEGGANCLYDKPKIVYQGPVCGNGIREKGEICDCGTKQECKGSQCCLYGCKLKPGAECNNGGCCKNCKIQNACTLCRPSYNPCDLKEYCDGASEECPSNLYKKDFSKCGQGEEHGYCYRGKCRSNQRQCRYIWGQDGKPDNKACFEFNVNGDASGNCGTKGKFPPSYHPCDPSDVMCGMIYCSSSQKYPVLGGPQTILNTNIKLPNKTTLSCRSATINLGDDVPDPGLVDDGSPCETNRKSPSPGICMNRKCIPVSQLQQKTCPKDHNGNECSGNGVCSNNGQCRCNFGFKPPDCSIKFNPCPEKSREKAPKLQSWLIYTIAAIATVISMAAIFTICIIRWKRKNRVEDILLKNDSSSKPSRMQQERSPIASRAQPNNSTYGKITMASRAQRSNGTITMASRAQKENGTITMAPRTQRNNGTNSTITMASRAQPNNDSNSTIKTASRAQPNNGTHGTIMTASRA